jgi:hypothetical protein
MAMTSRRKRFTVFGGIGVMVAVLVGWGLKSYFGPAIQQAESVNPYPIQTQPGMAMPNAAAMSGEQKLLLSLMTKYQMPLEAGRFLAQTKIKVLSETATSVHYVLAFANGVTSDETITISPNRNYTPTAADLQRPKRLGLQVFNPTLAQGAILPNIIWSANRLAGQRQWRGQYTAHVIPPSAWSDGNSRHLPLKSLPGNRGTKVAFQLLTSTTGRMTSTTGIQSSH